MTDDTENVASNDAAFMAWQKRWKLSMAVMFVFGGFIGLLIGTSMEANPGEDVTGLWGLLIGVFAGAFAHWIFVKPWFIGKYGEMPPVPPHRQKWHIG